MVRFITDIGFCQGVKNAVSILGSLPKEKTIYLYHPLRHNREENRMLRNKLKVLPYPENGLEGREKGDYLVFSAHGRDFKVQAEAENKGILTVSTTCPVILSRLSRLKKNRKDSVLFYAGKKKHPETIAFLQDYPKAEAITEDSSFDLEKAVTGKENAVLFTQSTLSEDFVSEAIKRIVSAGYRLAYVSPSCPVYSKRLEEAVSLLKEGIGKKTFAVLGDKSSSNTRSLFEKLKKETGILDGKILSSAEDVFPSSWKGKEINLACSTSISEESALLIYERLIELF